MSGEDFRFGEFELDGGAFELRRAGRTVHLERIPFELLCLLLERNGQLVARGEIVERIWRKDVYLDAESAVSTAVRKIRQALNDNPEAPRFIVTVPAKGYRFVAAVHQAEPVPSDGTPRSSLTPTVTPSPAASRKLSREPPGFQRFRCDSPGRDRHRCFVASSSCTTSDRKRHNRPRGLRQLDRRSSF